MRTPNSKSSAKQDLQAQTRQHHCPSLPQLGHWGKYSILYYSLFLFLFLAFITWMLKNYTTQLGFLI